MSVMKNKWVTGAVFLIGMAVIAGVCFSGYRLMQENNRLQAALLKTQKRLALTERKFSDEKKRTTALTRSKQSLEGIIRGKEEVIKKLTDEKLALTYEKENLEQIYKVKTDKLEEKIVKYTDHIKKLRSDRDELIERFKKQLEINKNQENSIAKLTEELKQTEYNLKRTDKTLENCRDNNRQLCYINEDLLEKYKNKGVMQVISINEPFTKLKKVEIEKLIQQYAKKIDDNKIEPVN